MKTLIAAFALIATAILAAYIALPHLAENRIRAALAKAGFGDAELTVETIGWRQASIIDVRIGDGLTIAGVTARYAPGEIIDGRLGELIVTRLTLRGVVRGDGVAFPSLDPFFAGGDGAGVIPFDSIVLRDCRVELATPVGDVTASVEGILHVGEDHDLRGLFDIAITAAPVALTGRLTITASRAEGYDAQLEITEAVFGAGPPMAGEIATTLKGDRLAVDGALYTPDGSLALTAGVTIADIAGRNSKFDLDAELWVTDPPLSNRVSLSQGRLALTLSGVIPDSTDPAGLALSGGLEMDLDEVTLPGVGDGLSLSGAITVETAGGIVTVIAEPGLRLDARRLEWPGAADSLTLDLETLRAELRPIADGVAIDGAAMGRLTLGGNGAVTAEFAGRIDLDPDGVLRRFDLRRLTASASAVKLGGFTFNVDRLKLSLAGTPGHMEGHGQVTLWSESLAAAGLVLTRPRLILETTLTYGGDGLSLILGEGASLDAASLMVAGSSPLAFHVETAGESVVSFARDGRIRHDLRLALSPMKIETPSLAATIALPALRLVGVLGEGYDGVIEITNGALGLPDQDLVLDGIDAVLELDRGGLHGAFTGRALRHPAIAPLAVSGSFDVVEDAIDFSGRLTDGGALAVKVAGRHALATGMGGASVEMARLALDPAGLQPGDLAPGLRGFASDVSGTVAAAGRLGWEIDNDGDGLTSEMTLLIENLSLDAGDFRLERVNAVIAFDSLWPPSTAPAQQLAIGLIDAGLPLTDGIIDFQLRPDGALYVESAVWRWAGGRLKTRNFLFDPDAERHAFTLEVDDLDLAEIVALSDMEDISASGRLSGRVPVTVTAEGLAIAGGRLETAEGGGFLRYAPEVAPAMLRQGGEGASLALNVLENFRYESLRIEIDRDAGGDAEIAVHLRGSNADVYDGFPIEFNLNISGPIDQMLRRGLEGYRVPDAVAEKLRGFGGQ